MASADEPGSNKETRAEHMNVPMESWQLEHPHHALLSQLFLSNGFGHWDLNSPCDALFSRLLSSTESKNVRLNINQLKSTDMLLTHLEGSGFVNQL